MASEGGVAGLLKRHRLASGLTQAQLSARAGVSIHSLRSWEAEKRHPRRETLLELARVLELTPAEVARLLAVLGDDASASPIVRTLRELRGEPAAWIDELAGYEWVTLIMNERHEILGWNNLANAVSEMDLGTGLPTQMERNLLWMASLPWYVERLTNWDELIGKLIATLKIEGAQLESGVVPPYLQAVLDRVAREHPDMLGRLFSLWINTPAAVDGPRNLQRVEWRLADGTELRFSLAYRDLSVFDGTFAFDWNAADAKTSAWVERTLAGVGGRAELPGVRKLAADEVPALLRAAREEVGLSRRALSGRAGVSEDAIFKYESGRRVPSRDAVLSVGRGLSLDAFEINTILEALGYDGEPSDLVRWLAGMDPKGIFTGRKPHHGLPPRLIREELHALGWPCFLLNARCEVEDANAAAAAITGYREFPVQPGRTGPHMLQVMVSKRFQRRLRNWERVATAILPSAMRPAVLGLTRDKSDDDLQQLTRWLGRDDPGALRRLVEAWDNNPMSVAPRRIWCPIEWEDDDGDVLRFHCFITPWNAYDPYWAIDWHPANPAAWRAVGRARS
jgi:transcriptional regulator with XRE-family HTH domain